MSYKKKINTIFSLFSEFCNRSFGSQCFHHDKDFLFGSENSSGFSAD